MTTFDIDTVPAPSDIEMAAMDAANAKRPCRYDFNGAARLLNINSDRERFHDWAAPTVDLSKAYLESTWCTLYKAFCQDEDARDQASTFADALR